MADSDPQITRSAPERMNSKRGRPVGDREGKRQELLSAGIAVLAEEGYAGASLRKVARKAGYTTGAVTYYFANKEALFMALLEQMFDQFDALLAQEEKYDIKKRFRSWLDINSDTDLWLAQFQLLAQARHEPSLAEIYQRRYAYYRSVLADALQKQQQGGAIRTDVSADVLADQLSAMGDGWMMLLPIEPERFTPDRIEQLLDALVALLAPQA